MNTVLNRDVALPHDFEILLVQISLDIKRLDGSIVIGNKLQTMRALKNGVDSYVDITTADGKLVDICCEPGKITDQWAESGSTHVRTEFSEPLKKGEVIEHQLSGKFVRSFMQDNEYWDQRQITPTDLVSIEINFLKGRPPLEYSAYEKRGYNRSNSDKYLKAIKRKGATVLKFEMSNPQPLSNFVVRWRW